MREREKKREREEKIRFSRQLDIISTSLMGAISTGSCYVCHLPGGFIADVGIG